MRSTCFTPLTRPLSSGTLSREGRGLWLDGRMGIEECDPLPRGRGWAAAGAFISRGGPGEGAGNTLPNLRNEVLSNYGPSAGVEAS